MRKIIVMICLLLSSNYIYAAKNFSARLCESGRYKCVVIQPGYTWSNLWPNPIERNKVKRFNRTNRVLRPGMVIALPLSNSNDLMALSPFERKISPPGNKLIVVNLKVLAWGAYDPDGNLVNWGPASGGSQKCSDSDGSCKTAVGYFEIYDVRGEDCVSTQYPINKGGAPMPYGMFFEKGYALHGSNEIPGYNASHGCVRLFKSDARWLNEEFVQSPGTTKVLVLPYQN